MAEGEAFGGRAAWAVEYDFQSGAWRAVMPVPARHGEYGAVGGVRLVRDLGLPRGASRAEAERALRGLVRSGALGGLEDMDV